MLLRRALPTAHFDRNATTPVTDLVHQPGCVSDLPQSGYTTQPRVEALRNPGCRSQKSRALKEQKILCKRRGIEQSRSAKMTRTCEATHFLPPLQGGPRLKSDTQGSAKPSPLSNRSLALLSGFWVLSSSPYVGCKKLAWNGTWSAWLTI
jgi:hypothetical protein